MDPSQQHLFLSLSAGLGKSNQTLLRYMREESYPADICIAAEVLTGGAITAFSLRPDLFVATPDQEALADACLASFEDNYMARMLQPTIAILNFFETQQPPIYAAVIAAISKLEGGADFIKQRMAHKANERS